MRRLTRLPATVQVFVDGKWLTRELWGSDRNTFVVIGGRLKSLDDFAYRHW